jgi:hypothetical protein
MAARNLRAWHFGTTGECLIRWNHYSPQVSDYYTRESLDMYLDLAYKALFAHFIRSNNLISQLP